MISVILSALRAARWRTAVLVLLGALPVAAAVAGPAYVVAAQRTIVATEVAGATASETVLTFQRTGEEPGVTGDAFERLGGGALETPGFTPIFGAGFDVAPPTVDVAWRMSYRDRVCAHVTFDAGRCATGRGEVMLGFRSAAAMKAHVGDAIPFSQTWWKPLDGSVELTRAGAPVTLSVVGIYRPVDPAEAYWGPAPPFPPGLLSGYTSGVANNVGTEPVYGSRATARLFALEVSESQAYDLVADPAALTSAWVDRHPAEITRLQAKAAEVGASFAPGTDPLMARIATSRSAVSSLVPWLALTVVPLCWFVIFMAAASGADTRRTELGQVALRGLPAPHRWWLAAGPDTVALLVGAPLGYVAGQVVGGLAAPGTAVDLTAGAWRFGLVALGGALLSAALAYRPLVAGRVTDLLRRITRRGGAWRSAVVDAMVVALAAVAVFELRTESGPVGGGLAILAPVLLILAGALLLARLLGPVARRAGARALRAGRLPTALAGIELSRRSAPRRAVTLAVLGVALLSYAVLAVDLGGAAREERAGIELGAERVFEVNPVAGGVLREAVRTADPAGSWAMAVVTIPSSGSGPPTVAADTDRLDAVAWPRSVPAGLRDQLRPPVSPSVFLDGDRIEVEATTASRSDVSPRFGPGLPPLRAIVQAVGEADRVVELGTLREGRRRYEGSLPLCEPRCRLVALEVGAVQATLTLTVNAIAQTAPDRVVADGAALRDVGRWRGSLEDGIVATAPKVTAAPDGIAVAMLTTPQPQRLVVADVPVVLPIVTTTSVGPGETDTGWSVASPGQPAPAPATSVGSRATLPGVGADGTLVDLEYLDRAAPMGAGARPQVWIGHDAPPDAVTRLGAAGLTVLKETSATDRARLAGRDGAALAARYELVTAGFALLLGLLGLGLIAAAEAGDRAARTRVLRAQGVDATTMRAAARRLRLWPILVGVVAGPALAAVAWVAASPATPVFLDAKWPLALPALPDPTTLGLLWVACAVPLTAAALLQRRAPA